jgi:hypothetical protein
MTNFYRYPLPIKAAVQDYYRRFGAMPGVIMVHPTRLAETQALGLAPQTSGGCLAGEVWLAQPDKNNSGGSAPAQLALF